VYRWTPDAEPELLHASTRDLMAPHEGPVVVLEDSVVRYGGAGTAVSTLSVGPGVTTARWMGQDVYVGFRDGAIERYDEVGRSVPVAPLSDPPSSAVLSFERMGPDTVFAGYADGSVVLWDLRTGAQLLRRSLHGGVRWMAFKGPDLLQLATVVGDTMELPLGMFTQDRCSLLRDVEAAIPTVWRGDRVQLAAGPADCD